MYFFKQIKEFKLAFLLAVAILCGLQSCEEATGELEVYPVKEKTLLVYMIANNNLSTDAVKNFEDMQKGYIPGEEDGNIVVYYHLPNQNPLLLNIKQGTDGQVQVDTSYRFPVRNSATKESLKSAMSVTATLFPANEYGLILWSHGTGWLPEGYYDNPAGNAVMASAAAMVGSIPSEAEAGSCIKEETDQYSHLVKMASGGSGSASVRSFGSDERKEMELNELVEAMPYRVSFVIFDACLMGGIEVAYQLKDSTDYIVFSPAEILSGGFPYSKIMQHIFAVPTDLESVAKEYYNYYAAQQINGYATVSLVKTAELQGVADIAKEIFDGNRDKLQSINPSRVQPYFRNNKHWFYDLKDFISQIATSDELGRFDEALDRAVVYKAATDYFLDIPITRYSGLSTYIPVPANETLFNHYRTLEWNKACGMVEDNPVAQ